MKDRRGPALTLLLTEPDFDVPLQRFAHPRGSTRHDWVLSDGRGRGTAVVILTAPERESKGYENVSQQMLHSVSLKQLTR